jgi:hypothetical protein
MIVIGSLGTCAIDAAFPPKDLPKDLHKTDSRLHNAEDNVDSIRCDVNLLRLWLEDLAVSKEVGLTLSDEELERGRELMPSLAMGTESAYENLLEARKLIHARAKQADSKTKLAVHTKTKGSAS